MLLCQAVALETEFTHHIIYGNRGDSKACHVINININIINNVIVKGYYNDCFGSLFFPELLGLSAACANIRVCECTDVRMCECLRYSTAAKIMIRWVFYPFTYSECAASQPVEPSLC